MKLFLNLFILSTLLTTACTGMKNTSSDDNNNSAEVEVSEEEKREEIILSEGYSKCEVVDMGTEDECGFVLQDLNVKELYKPLQWEGELAEYKQAGNIVYIKFTPSRATQTVCLQSKPIVLHEMKLVE